MGYIGFRVQGLRVSGLGTIGNSLKGVIGVYKGISGYIDFRTSGSQQSPFGRDHMNDSRILVSISGSPFVCETLIHCPKLTCNLKGGPA